MNKSVRELMETKNFELTFITDCLGTVPKNKEVYADYILKKAADKDITVPTDETETVEDLEEKGWTGFHKNFAGLFLYDYLIRGNIKANLETLIMAKAIAKIPSYKQAVDRVVFVYPREINFRNEKGDVLTKEDFCMERSIRAITPQGPRTCLVKSDVMQAERKLFFQITLFPNPKINWEHISTAMDYGQFYGISQWRGSGGYGRYLWKEI